MEGSLRGWRPIRSRVNRGSSRREERFQPTEKREKCPSELRFLLWACQDLNLGPHPCQISRNPPASTPPDQHKQHPWQPNGLIRGSVGVGGVGAAEVLVPAPARRQP